MFYFPGLSSSPWHISSVFDWCQELERNVPAIRAEYEELVHTRKASSDYDTGGDKGEHKLHSGKWDWHSYVLKGKKQEAFRQYCPLTVSLLDGISDHMRSAGCALDGRFVLGRKCLVFDDCYEHEVWNKTDGERVLLLFDLWHPELILEEREAIVDMFGYAAERGWLKGEQGSRAEGQESA